MDRLTKTSANSDMVWFVDHDRQINLEPCEMEPQHSRLVIQKLAQYENMEEQSLHMRAHKFQKEDFTDDEFQLLMLAFKLINDVVQTQRTDNSDTFMCNELYHLKVKLGVDDLVKFY